jgi:two-component sensor histidine kinase
MTIVETGDFGPGPDDLHRLREANHRISNHLTLIAGMVQMQISALAKGPPTLTREEARGLLQETAGKIVSIGHLHRRFAEQPQVESIEVADFLLESCTHLVSSLSLGNHVHVVQTLSADCWIAPEQAHHLSLLVSEIIMNAAKHAHPTGLPVQMSIACRSDDGGCVTVEIADDGVGLPEGFDPATGGGVGFRLIRSLAQSLKAQLDIESDSLGLTFRVTLPSAGSASPPRRVNTT